MTEPTPDLDERLARLAARKTSARTPTATGTSAPAAASASVTAVPSAATPTRSRRRHPAAAARILSVGLSSSAFFSIIGAFGEQNATHASNTAGALVSLPAASATRAPVRTTVVEKVVHHVLYVDQYGRPIPPPTVPAAGAAVPTGNRPATGSGQSRSSAPVWNNPGAGTPAVAPPPTPTPAGAPPVAGPAPTPPAVTPHPTTPPSPSPAPKPTPPPPTVVTTPPPPPPPACSGTKCP
jgi:hypothetical protein